MFIVPSVDSQAVNHRRFLFFDIPLDRHVVRQLSIPGEGFRHSAEIPDGCGVLSHLYTVCLSNGMATDVLTR